jgi:hypothetical protein
MLCYGGVAYACRKPTQRTNNTDIQVFNPMSLFSVYARMRLSVNEPLHIHGYTVQYVYACVHVCVYVCIRVYV